MYVQIIMSLLILMFILSGISKVFTGSEAGKLGNKLPFLGDYSEIVVRLAGLWELIGSVMILYGVWYDDEVQLYRGSMMLAVFTILATLIFYVSPLKPIPLLSNLTTLCGLLLLPYVDLDKN